VVLTARSRAPDAVAAEIIDEVQACRALFAQVARRARQADDMDAEADDGVEALLGDCS
jgi:predicted anti-sigma-YlaC factor YlaD